MKFFPNLSIKKKLILIIVMVTSFIIGIGFTVITINNINTHKNEMVTNTRITAQLIGDYCIAPLTFRDQKVVRNTIQKIETLPSIISAAVYDENGDLFASFQKEPIQDIPNSITPREKYFL